MLVCARVGSRLEGDDAGLCDPPESVGERVRQVLPVSALGGLVDPPDPRVEPGLGSGDRPRRGVGPGAGERDFLDPRDRSAGRRCVGFGGLLVEWPVQGAGRGDRNALPVHHDPCALGHRDGELIDEGVALGNESGGDLGADLRLEVQLDDRRLRLRRQSRRGPGDGGDDALRTGRGVEVDGRAVPCGDHVHRRFDAVRGGAIRRGAGDAIGADTDRP